MNKLKPQPRRKIAPKKSARKLAATVDRSAHGTEVAPESAVFSSELGWIALVWRGNSLTQISFANPSPAAAAQRAGVEPGTLDEAPAWIQKLAAQLQRYVAGEKVSFGKVALEHKGQTEFQKRVQDACRAIPRGQVRSYGELAAEAGSPGAARAVGSAMRANRFPLIVPCHRVVASGGNLGGFSCPQGVEVKERLLAMEGITLGKRAKG